MEENEVSRMETKATNLDDADISRLIGELVHHGEGDEEVSDQYWILRTAMEGRRTLNLNGVLSSYTGADRRRALTLVFRLVDSTSINTLLLQSNCIDAFSLRASLQNILAVEGNSQLSNVKVLDLANNKIGRGNGNTEKFSLHAQAFHSSSPSWERDLPPPTREWLPNEKDFVNKALIRGVDDTSQLNEDSFHKEISRSEDLEASEEGFEENVVPKATEHPFHDDGDMSGGVLENTFALVADAIYAGVFRRLQSLSLSKNPMCPEDMTQLGRCVNHLPDLQVLHLGSMHSRAIISLLSTWKSNAVSQLQELDFSDSHLHSHGILALLAIEGVKIRRLTLRNTGIMAHDCILIAEAIQLGKLGALESIDLSFNRRVGSLGLCALASSLQKGLLSGLREIFLSHCGIGDEGVSTLAQAIQAGYPRSLERLDLSGNTITSKSLVSLVISLGRRCAIDLKELLLSQTGLEDGAIIKLAEAISLGNLPAPEKLDFSGNEGLTDRSMVLLITSLQTGHLIHLIGLLMKLLLQKTSTRSDAVLKLVQVIKSHYHPALKKLDFPLNWRLTDKSMLLPSTSFQNGHVIRLRELLLACTGIGPTTVIALSEAISLDNLGALEKLHLSDNRRLTETSMGLLTNAFYKGHAVHLQELLLRATGMGDDALIKLAEAINLGNLPALEKLDLSGNRGLTKKPMVLLTTSFCTGHTIRLQELLLQDTGIRDDVVFHLVEAISLGNLPALAKLNLSYNLRLTDKSLVLLTASFCPGQMINLRELLLGGTGMGDNTVTSLARAVTLGNLKVLEKLDLSDSWKLTEKSMMLLATSFHAGHMIHLRELLLGGTGMGDDAVVKLAQAINDGSLLALEKLDLSYNLRLTDKSMVLLTTSFYRGYTIHLTELLLGHTGMGDDAVTKLAVAISLGNLPALETLDLAYNLRLTSKSMMLLGISFHTTQMSNLRELLLADTGMCNDALVKLAGAISLGNLPALETLELAHNLQLTDESMVLLATSFHTDHMIYLRELLLRGTGMGDAAVVKLAQAISFGNLPALETLDLAYNLRLTDRSMVLLTASLHTANLIHLKELLLGGTGMGDSAVVKLAAAISLGNLSALETLDLSHNLRVTDKSMVYLTTSFHSGHVIHLRELLLGGTGMGDNALIKLVEAIGLGNIPALETLDVTCSLLTDKSMVLLTTSFHTAHVIHLKELLLGGTGMGDDAVIKLAEAIDLGKLQTMEKLDLSGSWRVTDKSMVLLVTSFHTGCMIHLKELLLGGTGMGDDAIIKLAEVISLGSLRALEKLHLSGNPINLELTDKSMVLLATSFQTGHVIHLRELLLGGTGMGDVVVIKLAEAIKFGNLRALEKLDLSYSLGLSNKSMVLLTSSFCTGHMIHLRELLLGGTGMGDDAVLKLAEAINLGSLRAIEKLNYSGNKGLTENSIQQLTSALRDLHLPVTGLLSGSEHEELQLTSYVQSAGFSKWDQGFNSGQVLVLCDVTTSKNEAYFICFHVEGMASLFGIGVPHSKVSIILDRQEIAVEEMTESSWKSFWTSSHEGAFKPFLLEKSEFEMEELSQKSKKTVLHLTTDEALSKMGISMDGPQVQEFIKMSDSTSEDVKGQTKLLPRWTSLVKCVNDIVSTQAESQQGFQKPVQESGDQFPGGTESSVTSKAVWTSVDQISGGAKPNVADKTDESKQRGSLIVVVTFLALECAFYKSGDEGHLEVVDNNSDLLLLPQAISSIRPRLTVEFSCKSEENYVVTTLEGSYGMGTQEVELPCGWYQDDLRLSFQRSEDENRQCFLDDTHIKSKWEFVEIERTLQSGGSTSTQHEINSEGVVRTGILDFQVGGRYGKTGQSNESNQHRYKSKVRTLVDYPSFGINDHSNPANRMMEFRASYLDRANFSGSGLQSRVDMKVEGTWILDGEETYTYEFKAKKKLSKQTSTTAIAGKSSRVASWVGDENLTCFSVLDDRNVARRDEIPEKLWQIFNRKFLLNHNFSQFLEVHRKPSPYHWKLQDLGNQGNPVPEAIKVPS